MKWWKRFTCLPRGQEDQLENDNRAIIIDADCAKARGCRGCVIFEFYLPVGRAARSRPRLAVKWESGEPSFPENFQAGVRVVTSNDPSAWTEIRIPTVRTDDADATDIQHSIATSTESANDAMGLTVGILHPWQKATSGSAADVAPTQEVLPQPQTRLRALFA